MIIKEHIVQFYGSGFENLEKLDDFLAKDYYYERKMLFYFLSFLRGHRDFLLLGRDRETEIWPKE